MKNIFKYPQTKEWKNLVKRSLLEQKDLKSAVQRIFKDVSEKGDKALKELTLKFDRADLKTLEVTQEEINAAEDKLSSALKTAINIAYDNIYKFHAAQAEDFQKIETMPGVTCWRVSRAVSKVGFYIPGGSAPLFSTVLMLGIPARIAGCEEVILCTPVQQDGCVNPAILYTAKLCGISRIFKVGGAQAVAAMTLGTQTIPKVDKLFGPGNQYVMQAKQLALEFGVAIDLPAGPSEVLIIADRTAVPVFCAADLLAQAEHGTDSQAIFIATDQTVFEETILEVNRQIKTLSRREITTEAMRNSRFILVSSVQDALNLSNLYAPEHLILAVESAEEFLSSVKNAGSVFLGNFTPEAAGDYVSGTNHTLPTNGFAANYSGVSLDSFIKKITVQKITEKGLTNIGETVETMANAEGLDAHKNAVSIRLQTLHNGY